MRKDSLLFGGVCLVIFGCATPPRWLDEVSEKTTILSDRIVIVATASRVGGPATQYHLVIEKQGKSLGTLFHGQEGFAEGTTTVFELPAGLHEECVAMLDDNRFFNMKSAIYKGAASMAIGCAKSSIEVHHQGRRHVVTQERSAEIDDGFNKMWLFLGDVQKRSTVMKTQNNQPASIKRSGSELHLVSGLTPAGTLTPDVNTPSLAK